MAITISGTNGIVGAGFTLDASGASVTAGVGTFTSYQGSGASLTSIPAANIVGVATAGFERTGGYNSPSFSAYVTGNPAITGNATTIVVFNAEDHDTDGAYNTSTGVFTVPAGKAGKYHIDAYGGIDDVDDGDYTRVYVLKNGSYIPGLRGQSHSSAAGRVQTTGVSGTVTLAVGDEIKVELFTNTAGSHQIENQACVFSMFRLSI